MNSVIHPSWQILIIFLYFQCKKVVIQDIGHTLAFSLLGSPSRQSDALWHATRDGIRKANASCRLCCHRHSCDKPPHMSYTLLALLPDSFSFNISGFQRSA